jgi:hypothetical protein
MRGMTIPALMDHAWVLPSLARSFRDVTTEISVRRLSKSCGLHFALFSFERYSSHQVSSDSAVEPPGSSQNLSSQRRVSWTNTGRIHVCKYCSSGKNNHLHALLVPRARHSRDHHRLDLEQSRSRSVDEYDGLSQSFRFWPLNTCLPATPRRRKRRHRDQQRLNISLHKTMQLTTQGSLPTKSLGVERKGILELSRCQTHMEEVNFCLRSDPCLLT